MNTDQILKTLDTAGKIVDSALTTTERLAGVVGRGGWRWHRWRSLRLRIRAMRLDARSKRSKAATLRTLAAIHLGHAMRLEALRSPAAHSKTDEVELLTLLAGREPLANYS